MLLKGMSIKTYGGISLIGKAVVLKTTSNRIKVVCRFKSDSFHKNTIVYVLSQRSSGNRLCSQNGGKPYILNRLGNVPLERALWPFFVLIFRIII